MDELTPNDVIVEFLDSLPETVRLACFSEIVTTLGKWVSDTDPELRSIALAYIRPQSRSFQARRAIAVCGILDHVMGWPVNDELVEVLFNRKDMRPVRSIHHRMRADARDRYWKLRRSKLSVDTLDRFDRAAS